jgi:hypothetical protein
MQSRDATSGRRRSSTILGLSLPQNEGYFRVPAIPSFIALREFLLSVTTAKMKRLFPQEKNPMIPVEATFVPAAEDDEEVLEVEAEADDEVD